jgi:hypothetical protein
LRILDVVVAYLLASIASGFLLANIILVMQIGGVGSYVDPFPRPSRDVMGWLFLSFLVFPAVVALYCAAPFLVAALIGEVGRIRAKSFYLLAAILVCLVVDLALLAYHGRDALFFGLKGLPCGAVQGYLYWHFAGRSAGERR